MKIQKSFSQILTDLSALAVANMVCISGFQATALTPPSWATKLKSTWKVSVLTLRENEMTCPNNVKKEFLPSKPPDKTFNSPGWNATELTELWWLKCSATLPQSPYLNSRQTETSPSYAETAITCPKLGWAQLIDQMGLSFLFTRERFYTLKVPTILPPWLRS